VIKTDLIHQLVIVYKDIINVKPDVVNVHINVLNVLVKKNAKFVQINNTEPQKNVIVLMDIMIMVLLFVNHVHHNVKLVENIQSVKLVNLTEECTTTLSMPRWIN